MSVKIKERTPYDIAARYGITDIDEICLVVNMTMNKLAHIIETEGDAGGQRNTAEYWQTLLEENFRNYYISKITIERQKSIGKVS